MQVAGRRTVPVEVGQHYMQEDWGTSLMTLDDFIHQHITSAAGAGVQSVFGVHARNATCTLAALCGCLGSTVQVT